MKKTIVALGLLMSVPVARASTTFVNTVVSTPTSYSFDTSRSGTNCSVQIIMSSNSQASPTFTDGTPATGTISLTTNAGLKLSSATNSITVAAKTSWQAIASTNSITVSSNGTNALLGQNIIFNGIILRFGTDIAIGNTSSDTAKNIAIAMQGFGVIQSTQNGTSTTVYSTATAAGAAGNAFTLTTSTPSAITISGPTYAGGRNDQLNGAIIYVNGSDFPQGQLWSEADTSTGTATSIGAFLQNLGGICYASAPVNSTVIYTTACAGSAGNLITLSATPASILTVGSAKFTGGADNAVINVGTNTYTAGTDFAIGGGGSTTAGNIASTITASGLLSCSSVGSVVTCTAAVVGVSYNITTNSSMNTVSANNSTPSAVNLVTDSINIPNHGFGQAQSAYISKTAGTYPTPLVDGTTYYVIVVDANNIQLAATSTGAVAGVPLNITAQNTAGGGTFKLNVAGLAGTVTFAPEASSDNANWVPMSSGGVYQTMFTAGFGNMSNINLSSPYAATSAIWDFGNNFNSQFGRIKVTGMTAGGVNLKGILNCK